MEENIKKDEIILTPEEEAKLQEVELTDDRFTPSFELAKQYKARGIILKVVTYTFLVIFALFMLLPFIFMISVALKTPGVYSAETITGLKLFTLKPNLINFQIILGVDIDADRARELLTGELLNSVLAGSKQLSFLPYFINTVIVALSSTVFTVVTTVLASFAFARLEFKAKNVLFSILLATMMVPGEMILITNHATTLWLQWDNTFRALILVHGVSVFYIFQLRQTFQQIPNELFLASKVDGYGEFAYLWKVMIPIAMPTIVTIIILNIMGSWNAFMWPNMIATGNNRWLLANFGIEHTMRLVSNGLMAALTGEFGSYDTVKLAASMVVTAPLLLVFMFFRKYIMAGVSRSGIKG